MAQSKSAVVRFHEVKPGQMADFFVQLAEKNRNSTRDGKPFYSCRFRDRQRSAVLVVWADAPLFVDCERIWKPGQCYKVRGSFFHHDKYGDQIEVQQIRPVSGDDRDQGFDPLELVEHSSRNADELYEELVQTVESQVGDPNLKLLIGSILRENIDSLKLLPGSPKNYYPFAGGWLDHTVNVTWGCLQMADRYRLLYPELQPPLNRDLLIAGAVLHDVGRLREIDDPLTKEPGVEGRMIGHLILGRDIVHAAAGRIENFDPELLRLLDHMLLSHLTLPEWGSPRLPVIPEVLILHHVDDLDAKMEMYIRCLTNDQSPGPFTDRDPVLGKSLLKGRTV